MKILVTGAAGFIGSHLVDLLVANNQEVYTVDSLVGGFKENISVKSKFTKLDLREKEKVEAYISDVKPEILYHLAADATEGRSQFTPISATENNYLAYLYTLVPCIKNNLKKVVLVSSMSVYGSQKPPFSEDLKKDPDDIYGVAKAGMEDITEILAKVHGFEYTIVRPHNVYGPRQNMQDPYRNVVAIFINRLLQNKSFYIYGDGNQKRAFTYIDDLVPYIVKAGKLGLYNGEIFNLGPEHEYTINQLADIVLHNWFGENVPKEFLPNHLDLRPQEVVNAYCTSEKAKKILGYMPKTSLIQGLSVTIDWAKAVGPKEFKYIELELFNDLVPETWKEKLI